MVTPDRGQRLKTERQRGGWGGERKTEDRRKTRESTLSGISTTPVFWSRMDYASVWLGKNYCWWVPEHQGMASGGTDLESPPQKPVEEKTKLHITFCNSPTNQTKANFSGPQHFNKFAHFFFLHHHKMTRLLMYLKWWLLLCTNECTV